MQRSFILSISAVVMLCLGNAAAQAPVPPPPPSPPLMGTYAFAGSGTCVSASAGFNNSNEALGTSFSYSFGDEGMMTFNGDGTGTLVVRSTAIVPPAVGIVPSAGSSENSASFTYTVTGNTFTHQGVAGTDAGQELTGPRMGQTDTVVGVPMFTGLISKDRRTLTASILTPGVETVTYSNGDVRLRMCYRSRVYTKLD
jgi:hypothetical protein